MTAENTNTAVVPVDSIEWLELQSLAYRRLEICHSIALCLAGNNLGNNTEAVVALGQALSSRNCTVDNAGLDRECPLPACT